jgi:hypothetical protein
MIHKKISVLISTLALTSMVYAQQTPTGTPGNSSDWRRGGNLAAPPGLGGTNNIFGTMWNSPIYTVTNGVNRTRLNGNLTTTINGVTKPFNGYFGIGTSDPFGPATNFWDGANNTPWALLHLEGPNSTFFGGNGWRRWMETGMLARK